MKMKLLHLWQEMESSFWFVPGLIVLTAIIFASFMIHLDLNLNLKYLDNWPMLFGASAAGSRSLLSSVATSMITVAGVVFSITLVALTLTASQYSSRVLRHFMRNRVTQVVLGIFVAIFAYCLVVLRTIRDNGDLSFVPSLSVLIGLGLSFLGIGILIYFIHHVAKSIQACNIISVIAQECYETIDHLFPHKMSEEEELSVHLRDLAASGPQTHVRAEKTGYLEQIDLDTLRDFAKKHGAMIHVEYGIGDFVAQNISLLTIESKEHIEEHEAKKLNHAFSINRERSMNQDLAYGIQQIVDIALKALSPAINDPTTAMMCIDYLGSIFVMLGDRLINPPIIIEKNMPQVIAPAPSFNSFLDIAFRQIRQQANNSSSVLNHQLCSLMMITQNTHNQKRRTRLLEEAELIEASLTKAHLHSHDLAPIEKNLKKLRKLLSAAP